jgi:hypothetical protein
MSIRRTNKEANVCKASSRLQHVLSVGANKDDDPFVWDPEKYPSWYYDDTDDEVDDDEDTPRSSKWLRKKRLEFDTQRVKREQEWQRQKNPRPEWGQYQAMPDAWIARRIEQDIENILLISMSKKGKDKWTCPDDNRPLTRECILGALKKEGRIFYTTSSGHWPLGYTQADENDRLRAWMKYANDNLFDIRGGKDGRGYKSGLISKGVSYINMSDNKVNEMRHGVIVQLLPFRVLVKTEDGEGDYIDNKTTWNYD